MGLLLGIPDTDHAPRFPALVGEDIIDRPRIHGVLAHQISRIVDAEVGTLGRSPFRRVQEGQSAWPGSSGSPSAPQEVESVGPAD